jgi:hypothetical protein
MYSCQIGSKYPAVHVERDRANPIPFSNVHRVDVERPRAVAPPARQTAVNMLSSIAQRRSPLHRRRDTNGGGCPERAAVCLAVGVGWTIPDQQHAGKSESRALACISEMSPRMH